jgi:hypothetical protein
MHLDVVLQVVAGALSAAQQISSVEGVVHVPADAAGGTWQVSHAKLLALKQSSMEVAQSKHNAPELSLQHSRKKGTTHVREASAVELIDSWQPWDISRYDRGWWCIRLLVLPPSTVRGLLD